ncbi:MAG: helix-turn-helix transcriptional regulator [Chloroflexi bacterium]|nr:helix-turn-helix transcriptional regulator [Chloroflexota bacterium]
MLREQGRTLAWLADRTECPRKTVYAYSSGRRRASTDWLRRAAVALGLAHDAFLPPVEAA